MSRIYKVTTPTGTRLVDANTKSQAIGHCVTTDYSAEPISSSELYAAITAGAVVEKVEVAPKKLSSTQPQPSGTTNSPPVSATSSETALPNSVMPSAPVPSSTQGLNPSSTQPALAQPTLAGLPLPAPSGQSGAGAGWQAPQSANPILAEQQKINPKAVEAATPIIPINRGPATPPAAPAADTGWTARDAS